MATAARKIKVASNPTRRRNAPPRAKAQPNRKKNTMTAAKKKAFVARMAKARRKSAAAPTHRRRTKRAKNPTTTVTARRANPRAKRTRRRNPERRNGLSSIVGNPKTLATQAVVGLLSAVATRQLPQMALKANNVGWKGYAANAAAGLASAWAAGEFIGAPAAQAALIGASVILLDRVLTEKVSPIGKYLSLAGIGDATAAPSLGTIADGYFIHPTVVDSSGRPIIPHEITDAAMTAARNEFAPRQLQAMHGVPQGSTRFASRFQ